MAAVAELPFLAVLAAAEINSAIFVGGVGLRRKPAPFMRTVAHGLDFALPAGAPVIGFTRFNGYGIWRFLWNDRCAHKFFMPGPCGG